MNVSYVIQSSDGLGAGESGESGVGLLHQDKAIVTFLEPAEEIKLRKKIDKSP